MKKYKCKHDNGVWWNLYERKFLVFWLYIDSVHCPNPDRIEQYMERDIEHHERSNKLKGIRYYK